MSYSTFSLLFKLHESQLSSPSISSFRSKYYDSEEDIFLGATDDSAFREILGERMPLDIKCQPLQVHTIMVGCLGVLPKISHDNVALSKSLSEDFNIFSEAKMSALDQVFLDSPLSSLSAASGVTPKFMAPPIPDIFNNMFRGADGEDDSDPDSNLELFHDPSVLCVRNRSVPVHQAQFVIPEVMFMESSASVHLWPSDKHTHIRVREVPMYQAQVVEPQAIIHQETSAAIEYWPTHAARKRSGIRKIEPSTAIHECSTLVETWPCATASESDESTKVASPRSSCSSATLHSAELSGANDHVKTLEITSYCSLKQPVGLGLTNNTGVKLGEENPACIIKPLIRRTRITKPLRDSYKQQELAYTPLVLSNTTPPVNQSTSGFSRVSGRKCSRTLDANVDFDSPTPSPDSSSVTDTFKPTKGQARKAKRFSDVQSLFRRTRWSPLAGTPLASSTPNPQVSSKPHWRRVLSPESPDSTLCEQSPSPKYKPAQHKNSGAFPPRRRTLVRDAPGVFQVWGALVKGMLWSRSASSGS